MATAPVLAALDLSDDASPALAAAADLAERTGAALHLLNVRATMPTYVPATDPDAGFRALVEVKVDQALGPGACAQLAPEIHVVHGDAPGHATLELADRLVPRAVVLGTHGRRGYQRFAQGSVAEEVIREARDPVLAVPLQAARPTPGPDRPVLVATDLSDHGAAALRAGATFAAVFDAPLVVLHALPPKGFGAGRYVITARPDPDAEVPTETREAVRRHVAEAGLDGAEVVILHGAPDEIIDRVADEREAGCIVMGTHGRRGLEHALLGSVTESVLRGAPCGVLAVRA